MNPHTQKAINNIKHFLQFELQKKKTTAALKSFEIHQLGEKQKILKREIAELGSLIKGLGND